jgi:biotin carboxylase
MARIERDARPCVLLLMPTTSYKAQAFLDAASGLGVDVVVGTERRQALETVIPGHSLTIDLKRHDRTVRTVETLAARRDLRAIVGTDDETTVLAAQAARALGLRHNPPDAVLAARDKHAMRTRLAEAGLDGPAFRLLSIHADAATAARRAPYPCVLKPLGLAASRGVIRADDVTEFAAALRRIRKILASPDVRRKGDLDVRHVLVEEYMPGDEVAVEGLLEDGRLRVLAIFDKPDRLEGPYFAETIYVTPSRHPVAARRRVATETARACAALGLSEGPIHAELRIHGRKVRVIEIAARTIGGLCSRVLRFGAGISLEEIVLRHALGRPIADLERERRAAGVMMLPVPRPGRLRGISGIEAARRVAGIVDVVRSIPDGALVLPSPDGDRYLGFVFARRSTPAAVEAALRRALARLSIEIEPTRGVRNRARRAGDPPDPRAARLSRTTAR